MPRITAAFVSPVNWTLKEKSLHTPVLDEHRSSVRDRFKGGRLSFGDAEDLGSRKRTRREVFLAQMEQVV
ncbi:MAG TPA: hypothetical protein VNK45_07585, partial [Candidatus Acidoferrales bacterium]|nr:hypothetical protein [Candidatus Acidoferrales bacterium]